MIHREMQQFLVLSVRKLHFQVVISLSKGFLPSHFVAWGLGKVSGTMLYN